MDAGRARRGRDPRRELRTRPRPGRRGRSVHCPARVRVLQRLVVLPRRRPRPQLRGPAVDGGRGAGLHRRLDLPGRRQRREPDRRRQHPVPHRERRHPRGARRRDGPAPLVGADRDGPNRALQSLRGPPRGRRGGGGRLGLRPGRRRGRLRVRQGHGPEALVHRRRRTSRTTSSSGAAPSRCTAGSTSASPRCSRTSATPCRGAWSCSTR